MFERNFPKLTHREKLHEIFDEKNEPDAGTTVEEVDRVPRELIVERYHIFCFIVSIISYIFDIGSDIYVGVSHYRAGRDLAAVFIFIFACVPSIVQNIIFFAWEYDDHKEKAQKNRGGEIPKSHFKELLLPLPFCLLITILQLGPVWLHCKTIYYGLKFRKCKNEKKRRFLFCKMIESERDVTLLRLFEGFLESAPQLVIQSTVLYEFLWLKLRNIAYTKLPRWVYIQIGSLFLSLFSLCWSITSQHRTIRIATPDKVNVHPHETLLQLVWRAFTVLSRTLVIGMCIMYFKYFTILFGVIHYIISLVHIVVLQSVDLGQRSRCFEIGIHLINAFVHIFIPFNAAEGATRWRYGAAYLVEFFEGVIVYYFVLSDYSFYFTWKNEFALISLVAYFIGLSFMVVYYSCFHPNRRKHKRIAMVDGVPESEL